jgi:hypothetical protein
MALHYLYLDLTVFFWLPYKYNMPRFDLTTVIALNKFVDVWQMTSNSDASCKHHNSPILTEIMPHTIRTVNECGHSRVRAAHELAREASPWLYQEIDSQSICAAIPA